MSAQGIAITVLLISFLVMILLRFPIAYAVALSSLLCLLTQGLPLTTICQQMVKGISSFSLMAVPFFITMGVLMGTGGISEKLIALCQCLRRLDDRWYGNGKYRSILIFSVEFPVLHLLILLLSEVS